jgi:hypothetical protein
VADDYHVPEPLFATCCGGKLNRAEIVAFLSQLQTLNLQLRAQLEFAEHLIPQLNQQIAQLGVIRLLDRIAILGDIIYDRCYLEDDAGSDGLVLQAALLAPGGIGAIAWDREEYLAHLRRGPGEQHTVQTQFMSFNELASGQKAVLLRALPRLLNELHIAIRAAGAGK